MSAKKRNTKKESPQSEESLKLEQELGLPAGFLEKIYEEDDWSFIIKLHSLMEASVSYLLVHHFGDERLNKIFDYLELSDVRKGKLAFVSELDLLPSENRRFLRKLSEMRNTLVHKISNVSFNLEQYVLNLNKDQFNNFIKDFESVDLTQIDFGKNKEHLKPWIAFSAKGLIFRFAMNTIELIYLKKETSELKRKINDVALDFMNRFTNQNG